MSLLAAAASDLAGNGAPAPADADFVAPPGLAAEDAGELVDDLEAVSAGGTPASLGSSKLPTGATPPGSPKTGPIPDTLRR